MEVKGQIKPQTAHSAQAPGVAGSTPVPLPEHSTSQQPAASQAKPTAVQGAPSSKSAKPDAWLPTGRRRSGVLLITRTQLFIYVEGMTGVPILQFSPDVIRDLDVVNADALIKQIEGLVMKHQMPTANFSAVLANQTLFSRQVVATDAGQKKIDEEQYLNTIPFDNPSVTHVTLGQNTYIVVANKGLFEPIDKAFEAIGSDVALALPEFLFPKELGLSQGLSVQSAEVLLKKVQEFKDENFIKKESVTDVSGITEEESNNKLHLQVSGGKSNKKLVIGGAVFMALGVILAGVLLVQQNQSPQSVPPSPRVESPQPTAIPAAIQATDASESAQEQSAPSSGDVQGVVAPTILINYQPGNEERADALRLRLLRLNFSAITTKEVDIISPVAHVAYGEYVSGALVQLITDEVRAVEDSVRATGATTGGSDIVITLASN